MEPESSSPYPQVPAICPYPEPTPSSPHHPTPQLPTIIIIIIITISEIKNVCHGK
jgi:hypothetical protein